MLLLLVVSCLLLFTDSDVSAQYYLTCKVRAVFKPPGYSESLKDTGTILKYLNCSVEQGKTASKITWKIQDEVLKQASGPIKWLGFSFDITAVRRVENLRCEVMVGNKNHSCGFEREAPPRIKSPRHFYETYVGTSLVIPCHATGSPQPVISWIKRGRSLAAQDVPQSIEQIRSPGSVDLVFKEVSMMHRGIYMCHAVNRWGKDTHSVFVSALYHSIPRPPRVVPLHHVITVPKGSTAVLVCSAKNSPKRYTAPYWDHNGTRVTNTARHHITSWFSEKIVKKKYKDQMVDMSLTVSHVTSKDVGMYTCGVVTHVGRHENHVELRIEE